MQRSRSEKQHVKFYASTESFLCPVPPANAVPWEVALAAAQDIAPGAAHIADVAGVPGYRGIADRPPGTWVVAKRRGSPADRDRRLAAQAAVAPGKLVAADNFAAVVAFAGYT